MDPLVTIRAVIHIRCQLTQAELTTLIMLMKIRQFCPKSGELERVSHKNFLSYVISCHSQATSESKELDRRGKPRWSREAETLVMKSAVSKRHKTLWPLKTVLCFLWSPRKAEAHGNHEQWGDPGCPQLHLDNSWRSFNGFMEIQIKKFTGLITYMPEGFFLLQKEDFLYSIII